MNLKKTIAFLILAITICFTSNALSVSSIDIHISNEALSPILADMTVQTDSVKADFDEFPNLHPLVVHFPVVLLLLATILQLIQLFVMNRTMDWVILLTIGGGFIGAYIATSLAHPHTEGLTQIAQKVLDEHDKYADWTVWSSAGAAVLKIISLSWLKLKRSFEIVVLLVMIVAAYSVSQAGHYGCNWYISKELVLRENI